MRSRSIGWTRGSGAASTIDSEPQPRVELADNPADDEGARTVVRRDDRAPARMQDRLIAQWLVAGCIRSKNLGDELDGALRVVQVGVAPRSVPARRVERPRERQPQPPPFSRLVADAAVALADLEQRHVGAPMARVRIHDLEEAADQ